MALEIQKVNPQEITDLILAMDAEINRCNEATEELQISDEDLAGYGYDDVKRFASELNGQIKQAEDARKDFKRRWQEPQKAVEAAFRDALASTVELRDRYKAELGKRDEQRRQERYELLCEFYEQEAPKLAELVPIERFGIVRERISVAKSYSAAKEEAKLHAEIVKALNAWDALIENDLEFAEEAEAEFFRTLDLNAALALNARRKAERERIGQLHAELGVAPAEEPQEEPAQAGQPAPEPDPAVPQRQDAPDVREYAITAQMTTSQWFGLKGYMKAAGIDYRLA